MRRFSGWSLLFATVLAACGTPEIARDYETKTYVPAELEAALTSDDPARRADAAEQILAMDPAERKTVLTELVTNDRVEIRLMATGLLGKHHAGDSQVVKVLGERAALDVDIDVRSSALTGLAASGRPEALSSIVSSLTDDPALVVRREAAVLLDRLTGEKLGDEFAKLVSDAEEAADDAAFAYDDWVEANRDRLRWDAEDRRFTLKEESP
jgi:HEAT repeat protein